MAFQKGKSGNPNGRPKKGKTMTDLLEAYLDEPVNDGNPETKKIAFIKHVLSLAMDKVNPSFPAIKYIWDRIEGSPVSRNELSGPDGEDLTMTIKIVDIEDND